MIYERFLTDLYHGGPRTFGEWLQAHQDDFWISWYGLIAINSERLMHAKFAGGRA